MVASEKKDRASHDRKTKGQLRRKLEAAQGMIREKRTELAAFQKNLTEAQNKAAPPENSFVQTDSRPEGDESFQMKDSAAAQDSVKSAQALEELRALHLNVKGECETLKKRLRETEEQAQKHAEAVKREQRESERQRRNYEGQIQGLTKKLAEAKERAINMAEDPGADEVAASRAAFRIFLYARQDGFQGRIEHTLTQEKKIFTGLDQTAIMEFIENHPPRWDNGAEEVRTIPLPEVRVQADPAPAVTETTAVERPLPRRSVDHSIKEQPIEVQPAPQMAVSKNVSPRLVEMKTISMGSSRESKVILHNEPFAVELTLDFTGVVNPAGLPLDSIVLVSARRLEGGSPQVLGKSTRSIAALTETVRVPVGSLDSGLYRLQARVDICSPAKHDAPSSKFLFEKKLLVC